MKGEKEIRKHRDDLLTAARAPCNCSDPMEIIQCRGQRAEWLLMAALLTWVLDADCGSYDLAVEELAAAVRR